MTTNYMSRLELDELGEAFIQQYFSKHPSKAKGYVDIDNFISDYLGLTIQYLPFAENDMGKLAFLADGRTPLLVYQYDNVVPCILPKNTIAISTTIIDEKERNRCRFAKAHEASHFILSRVNKRDYCAQFYNDFSGADSYGSEELFNILNADEWQANALGSAILMPKFLIQRALAKYNNSRPIKYYGSATLTTQDKAKIKAMANELRVSLIALTIRLKDLQLLEYHDMGEYITSELMIGD